MTDGSSDESGVAEAETVANDRPLLMAALFVLSRRNETPTFAYQLQRYDRASFHETRTAKDVLDRLARMGILARLETRSAVASQLPVFARGDSDCFFMTEFGVRVVRAAYRSFVSTVS